MPCVHLPNIKRVLAALATMVSCMPLSGSSTPPCLPAFLPPWIKRMLAATSSSAEAVLAPKAQLPIQAFDGIPRFLRRCHASPLDSIVFFAFVFIWELRIAITFKIGTRVASWVCTLLIGLDSASLRADDPAASKVSLAVFGLSRGAYWSQAGLWDASAPLWVLLH